MIHECAQFTIGAGRETDFEATFEQAKQIVAMSPGFEFIQLTKGCERRLTYQLVIGWATLEDHTVGFRESELYEQWRALMHPFLSEPVSVEHWELVGDAYPKRQ